MFEVKCFILLQANVFLFLPYVPTAVLLAGDLFFFGQMDLGPLWDIMDIRTLPNVHMDIGLV